MTRPPTSESAAEKFGLMYRSLKYTSPPCSVTLSIRTGTGGPAAAAGPAGASPARASAAALSCPAPFATIPWRFSVPSALTMILE